jgi:hypothetical protein
LQQLRRIDRAAGQQHLAAGKHAAHNPVLRKFETDCAPALEQYPLRQCAGHDPQIGPLQRRTQIGDRGAAPAHVAYGHLQWPDPVLLGAVEIGVALVARLLGGGYEGIVQFVLRAQIGDVERAAGAVMHVGAALLIFRPAEIRQHIVIRPAGIAELAPQIEILLLPADINQPVDRTGAAEHLAARPDHAPAAQFGERLGLELPGDLWVVDIAVEAGRNVDPRIAVLTAGLEQQYARAPIRAEPVGQHAPGRTSADNDEIEFRFLLHQTDFLLSGMAQIADGVILPNLQRS